MEHMDFNDDAKAGGMSGSGVPANVRAGFREGFRKGSNDVKKGYLDGDFACFHLRDVKSPQFEYHYHDFSKIIIFISGNVTYHIEGRTYRLKPWDVLFINSSEVHKAAIDPSAVYERIIIWVNHGFLERHSDESSLLTCFNLNSETGGNLLRPDPARRNDIALILEKLENACVNNGFGSAILKNALFLQLLVELTRERLQQEGTAKNCGEITDYAVQKILDYINSNLDGDLSVNALASKFYTNRYHLMHKFKRQTGYSVHSYILQKRLIKADSLIRSGITASQASEECGFNDYSSFSRAFKKLFGTSPSKRAKAYKINTVVQKSTASKTIS